MRKTRFLLTAVALAGGLFAASAGAVDSGDRGVKTPSNVEQTPMYRQNIPGGQPAIPRGTDPMNPNESKPFVQVPEGTKPLMRGDNLNLPSPRTPSAANESSPRVLTDPTNSTGMGRAPVGATH